MDSTIEATFNAYIETLEARRATLRTELRAEREAQIKALDCVEANMVRYRKNLHEMLEKELAMIVDPATTSADREVELEKMTKKTLDDINKDHLVLPLVEIKFDPAKEADDVGFTCLCICLCFYLCYIANPISLDCCTCALSFSPRLAPCRDDPPLRR